MKRAMMTILPVMAAILACSLPLQPGDVQPDSEEPAPPAGTEAPEPATSGLTAGALGDLGDAVMAYVPQGCFEMGSSEAEIAEAQQACTQLYSGAPFPCDTSQYLSEAPQHQVCLDEYWIGQTEVTNRQYAACVEAGACPPPVERTFFDDPAYADHPVINVPWASATAYAAWMGGRLPTEAEWEYAARGPDADVYPWGEAFDRQALNFCDVNCDVYFWADTTFDDGFALTAPVAHYPLGASWVGAVDMSGNVWEWVSSLFADYPYDPDDGREDPHAEGDRVLRGGAFDLSHPDLRAAFRYVLPAAGTCRGYGFRLAADRQAVVPRNP